MDADLNITWEPPTGRAATGTLTVRHGGIVIVRDRGDINREAFRKKVAAKVYDIVPGVTHDEMVQALLQAATQPPPEPEPARASDFESRRRTLLAERDEEVEELLKATPQHVRDQAEAMLADPKLVNIIINDVAKLGVVGERKLAMSHYMVGVSRSLPRPLGSITQGGTSSGKSHTLETTGQCFPLESKLLCTDITPQSLYYLELGRLMHTFVIAGERPRVQSDEQSLATKALREMLSSGELHKLVTISVAGRPETVLIDQPGPIAYADTTTLTRLNDEDANRCLLLATDESAEQTRNIKLAIAEAAETGSAESAPIIARHHALQRMLRRVEVRVPFATRLAEAMPDERNEARRAIGHIISLIRAIALLHQRQRAGRTVEHGDIIQATVEDYVIARHLLVGPLGRALGRALTPAVANLAKRLTTRYGCESFTTTQAAQDDVQVSSRPKMADHLRTLLDAGTVDLVEPSRGPKPSIWKVVADVPEDGILWLPSPSELEPSKCLTA